ncbi:MAG: hypothetical protein ACPGTO_01980 [Polaribacter sp.]
MNKEYKIFLWILIYSVLNQMLQQYYGDYIDGNENLIFSNIYNAIYFSFLFWLFYTKTRSQSFKNTIVLFVILYFLSIGYEVFIQNLNYHSKNQVIPYIIGGIGVLACVFEYLLSVINSEKVIHIYRDLLFWIAIAHFIYYLTFIPFKMNENYFLGIKDLYYLFNLKIGATLLKSIFLSIGFIWSQRQR